MVTFQEAREIAINQLGPRWKGYGTFCVAEWGYENSEYWNVIVGAREFLVNKDVNYCIDNNQAVLVEKETGILISVPLTPALSASRKPVGSAPKLPK